MKINNRRLDRIISKLEIKYGGCHAPHSQTPLYGRSAYWRLYVNGRFIAKITTHVEELEPDNNKLQRLFKSELRRRIEQIRKFWTYDHYGHAYLAQADGSSLRRELIPLALENHETNNK